MFDLTETDRLLTTTRAVRRRLDLDRPVPLEVVLDCLRLATPAPTASNRQDWRWLVVTDPELIAGLGAIYRRVGEDYLARAAATEQDPQTRRVYESALALVDVLPRVPVVVVPCLARRIDLSSNGLAAAAYGSVLPAAWSFQLALRSRGLGSVWTTLHLHAEEEAAALLGVPADATQVALLPVAYTVGEDFRPAARPPVEDVTFLDRWGQRP